MAARANAPSRGLLVAIVLLLAVIVAEAAWLVVSPRAAPPTVASVGADPATPAPVVPQRAGVFDLAAETASIDAAYVLGPDARFVRAGELLEAWTGAGAEPVSTEQRDDFDGRLAALRRPLPAPRASTPARGLRDAGPAALGTALGDLSDALDAGVPDAATAAAGAELMGLLATFYARDGEPPDTLVSVGLALLALAHPDDPVTLRAHALVARAAGYSDAAAAAAARLPDNDAVRAFCASDRSDELANLARWDRVAAQLATLDDAASVRPPDAPWPAVWRALRGVDDEAARLAVLAAPADALTLCAMAAARPEVSYVRVRRDNEYLVMASLANALSVVDREAETVDALVASIDETWRATAPTLLREPSMWHALCLDPLAEALVAHAEVGDPVEDPGRWGPALRAELATSSVQQFRARYMLATRVRAAALGTLEVDAVLAALDELDPIAFDRLARAWTWSAPIAHRDRVTLAQGAAARLDDRPRHRARMTALAREVLYDDRLAEQLAGDERPREREQHDLDRLAVQAASSWRAGDDEGAAASIAAFPYPASDEAWRRSIGSVWRREFVDLPEADVALADAALRDAGVGPQVRRVLLEELGQDQRPALAFDLLDGVPLQGADDWGAIATMASLLHRGRGPVAASRWLDATIDRGWREPFALAAWEHRLVDALWDFVSVEGLPPTRTDYLWLLRAASPHDDPERASLLEAWLRSPPHSHYHHIASFLVGEAELDDIAGLAVDANTRCELAFFAGLRARTQGDEETARAWFRVAVESGAERMIEWRWAWLALAGAR